MKQSRGNYYREWDIHDGCEWKARVLEYLYPYINSVIDDDADLITHLNEEYNGRIYLFSYEKIASDKRNIFCCKDWESVIASIKHVS